MTNLIYAYIKIDSNEIVYIGRTNNLANRRRQHEQYEPFDSSKNNFNYPLSRGIRKYGANNYKCIIIEDNLTYEESLERERYWIAYYDTYRDPAKYNLSPGGEYITDPIYPDDAIENVRQLLKQQIPFQKIQEETGISISHISEINTGKRRPSDLYTYPINAMTCGRKLTQLEVLEIIDLLKQNQLTNQEIGIKYNIGEGAIASINKGRTYRQNNIEYPIRGRIAPTSRHKLSDEELHLLINDIINTTIPFAQLALKYHIGTTTVYNINTGKTRKQLQYTYPLRKK